MSPTTFVIVVLLFVWAFAEAYVWPIVPDAALAVVVFTSPDTAAFGVAAAVLGSAVGGTSAVVAYRRGWRWPLPLVTEEMQDRVHGWLATGPRALRHQPLTAVPYKAFVVEAARRGMAVAGFAWWTVVFRGLRMAATACLALVASQIVTRWSPTGTETTVRFVVLGVSLIVFLIGWRVTYRMWATSASNSERSPGGTPANHRMRS